MDWQVLATEITSWDSISFGKINGWKDEQGTYLLLFSLSPDDMSA